FLPYAGGSQYSYSGFTGAAKRNGINIIPIEVPGRGSRINEPLLVNISDMVNDIFDQVKDHLKAPYGIYGHSMGTILGYLLTRKIVNENLNKPCHLFFSGSGGPSVKDQQVLRHL